MYFVGPFPGDGSREGDTPPAERVILAGTTGVVTANFTLPLGQDVQVRVIDAEGSAVEGAELRVRYHEPEKPARQVSFEREERTDGDGRLLLRDVGIQVPFVVDVLAPHHLPVSSRLTELEEGETQMEDIVLGEPGGDGGGGTAGSQLLPVPDTWVGLLADPAGLPTKDHDSWLHHRAFRQRMVTSPLGNVRFTGAPPGHILLRVKTETGTAQEQSIALSKEEIRVSLELP